MLDYNVVNSDPKLFQMQIKNIPNAANLHSWFFLKKKWVDMLILPLGSAATLQVQYVHLLDKQTCGLVMAPASYHDA